MNQKTGNFPGVTVDKKIGESTLDEAYTARFIDLPGTYSLYPRRNDEWAAYKVLMKADADIQPDIVLLVADASNLKRNLLFCSQIIDLKYPVVVALTMLDMARKKNIHIDIPELERELGVPVVAVNPRKNKGLPLLKKTLVQVSKQIPALTSHREFICNECLATAAVSEMELLFPQLSNYARIHYLMNHENFPLPAHLQNTIENIEQKNHFNHTKVQAEEIMQRYKHINQIMQQTVSAPDPLQKKLFTEKLDNILLHKIWGYVILLLVLFILFQSIFWIAQYPMNGIDWLFFQFSNWLNQLLPENQWSNFLINGIIAGLNGVLIFVPQIMILFGLITVLEDSGYMTRISFLSDKLTRKVGLNGKSVMPMISGFACAIPAIMSTRSIENKKERLLTILITPFMSCSARLPVFTILISLVIPNIYFAGFLSLQGLVMMALYLFGLIMAFAVSYVLNRLIHIKDKSFFILELPDYRMPRWKNIFTSMLTKAKIFITNAGKVIIIISIILWFLSSYGPKEKMQLVKHKYTTLINTAATYAEKETYQKQYNTEKLENSYAGVIGRTVEPVIQPLGYDWKIGIALITSFAAREIFVGTMSTLYSVEDNNNTTLVEKMNQATREDGTKLYTLATGLSLMMFYLLAMQCMNTLVVVYQETKSLRWPIIQFLYMTGLAYIMSFLVYQIFRS